MTFFLQVFHSYRDNPMCFSTVTECTLLLLIHMLNQMPNFVEFTILKIKVGIIAKCRG